MNDSFNIDELKKIKKATSGFFKKKAREKIAISLIRMKKEVDNIYKLYPLKNLKPTKEHRKKFLELMNKYTSKRQNALLSGAGSYSHPEWAAASACESWAYLLMAGTDEEVSYANNLIQDLIDAGTS